MSLFEPSNVDEMLSKKDIPGLIKALSYKGDEHVRELAAIALGEIGDQRAVAPLITILNDDNEDLRRIAVESLKKIYEPAAMSFLDIKALSVLIVNFLQPRPDWPEFFNKDLKHIIQSDVFFRHIENALARAEERFIKRFIDIDPAIKLTIRKLQISKSSTFEELIKFQIRHLDSTLSIEIVEKISQNFFPETVPDKMLVKAIAYLLEAIRNELMQIPEIASFVESPEITSLEESQSLNDVLVFPSTIDLYLEVFKNDLLPYLEAIDTLQETINSFNDKKSKKGVLIKNISQNSPISVSLSGASEAVGTIRNLIIPWRREHEKEMLRLEEIEKHLEIEKLKAEVLEIRAKTKKERIEGDKLLLDINNETNKTTQLKPDLEREEIELHKARIELAQSIINQFAQNMEEVENLIYIKKLIPVLITITESALGMPTVE